MLLHTYPSPEDLLALATATPEYMRPNQIPFAVALEGFLDEDVCDHIREAGLDLESYTVRDCGAITRECEPIPALEPIEDAARTLNRIYWEYDLDPGQQSWLQTYEKGMNYQRHMDGSPGQMRKLTAVAFVSPETDYDGGDLRLYYHPMSFDIPRTRGTVVVFQPWIEHEVLPVTGGIRQSINMGFWGPPFK